VPIPITTGDSGGGEYKDIKVFCKSAAMQEIQKHNFVLTPSRYVGIENEVDHRIPFEEKGNSIK
jgi:type I restriction enzyme M protein